MIKVVSPSSFNFDQQVMSLVDVHSRGVDSSWMRKSAAVLTKELSEIRPEPGTSFVHLIALGDAETYSGNRNGDLLPRATNETCHDTFVKYAKWFHNHKNKPHRGDKVYGSVKCSAYNPDMHRVELIVGIDEKKDPDTIEKLARGEDIPVSMALTEAFDVCSICGHKAASEQLHCSHIKEACSQLTDDGRFIGMINPPEANIKFFDISRVGRNADRIAFTLRKVAGVEPVVLSTDLAKMYGLTEPTTMVKDAKYLRRFGLLEKFAKLEKQIEGEIRANPSMQTVADGLNEPVSAELGKIPEDKVLPSLGKLASERVILPMVDFFKLAMGPRFAEVEKDLPAAQACLPTVFSGALKTAEEFLSGVDNYEPVDSALPVLIKNILTKVGQQARLTGGCVQARIAGNTLRKTASVFVPNKSLQETTQIGTILATEYARYKLAALDRVEDPLVVKLAVLQDFGH